MKRILLLSLACFVILHARVAHLTLVPPYNDYHSVVHSKLLGAERPVFAMLVFPSFQPEFSVSIVLQKDQKHYDVAYSKPQTAIWKWKSFPDGHEELDLSAPVVVDRVAVEIDPAIVQRIVSVVGSVLNRTRYPEEPMNGLDGVVYEFTDGFRWGSTWSPDAGAAAEMVRMGASLKDFALSSKDQRETCKKKIYEALRKLEAAGEKSF